jgi:hypothetical protein
MRMMRAAKKGAKAPLVAIVERPESEGLVLAMAHPKQILDCIFLYRVLTCQPNFETQDKIKTSSKT